MAGKRLGEAGATFKDVWDAFPSGNPCTNAQFSNQCAIRLSHALLDCGVSLDGFSGKGVLCWNDSSRYGGRHIIRAEEFARWLSTQPIPGLGARQSVRPAEYQTRMRGKQGIVFFKDYWQRRNEIFPNRSGDHIDLWNKNRTTGYWFSWSRDFREDIGAVSDRNDSREIWFWSIP